MELEISDHHEILASELAENQSDVLFSAGNPASRLHDQCDRIAELFSAKNHENQSRFPDRGSCPQTFVARIAEYREKVDNANSELVSGDESNGNHI